MSETFEWDEIKNALNIVKHGISFENAQVAFLDPHRIIYLDVKHSTEDEKRYFCLGIARGSVCTLRFTYRNEKIRIFGAGFWRKEQKIYEAKHKTTHR